MLPALLICLTLAAHAFAGYPALMAVLARLRARPWRPAPTASLQPPPGLSLVLCTHNAADLIASRVQNLLSCSWDGPVQLVVLCDGCTDGTADRLRALPCEQVEMIVLESETREGKAAGLNAALPHCRHPIAVLCDVRQSFAHDALTHLAAPFADPTVGAVSGQLEIASSSSGAGRGVDLYWRLETKLRFWESQFDSVIGCTGAICALRTALFAPLPNDTLLDDVVIPMRIAAAGYRVIYEPRARAFDPQPLDPDRERRRKLRTLVGNFQMLERHPEWLAPWYCRLWWQLASHKYLRLAGPWLLIALAALSLTAPPSILTRLLVAGQAGAYGLALLGCLLPRVRWRLLTVPAGFVLLQVSCMAAFFAYLKHRGNYLSLWRPASAAPSKA